MTLRKLLKYIVDEVVHDPHSFGRYPNVRVNLLQNHEDVYLVGPPRFYSPYFSFCLRRRTRPWFWVLTRISQETRPKTEPTRRSKLGRYHLGMWARHVDHCTR